MPVKKSELKMKCITRADLFYNGMPVPIDSIVIESTDLSADGVEDKLREEFHKKMAFRFVEKWVKK